MSDIETEKPYKFKNDLQFYIPGIIKGKYTYKQASDSTGYSIRWLYVLKKKYEKYGEDFMKHGNSGRVSPAKTPQETIDKILLLYATDYKGLNFKYFQECLEEYENIYISYPTLRKVLLEAGIHSPEAHKTKKTKPVHRPRLRRKCEGDLLQLDGTPFQWFNRFGDNNYYDLMGSIDDATGKITGLYMCNNECFYGYSEVLRQTINKYGRPREVYTDRAAIFCCAPKKKQNMTVWEQLEGVKGKSTQWQRVLAELNIRQILAWSPQAKGRVERMWSTIQGRLPYWFFRKNIKTMEEANRRLPEFIEYFNKRFSVKPRKDSPVWLPAPVNLDDILCAQIPRLTDSNGCFSFHSYKFEIVGCMRAACKNITVCISERGFEAKVDGKYYSVKLIDDDYIYDTVGDNIPQVLKDIMYKYLFECQKEVSC